MADEVVFDMIPVTSSQISAIGYNKETQQMRTRFIYGDSLYEYEGIPESVFDAVLHAPSVGSVFNATIKRGGYSYRRIG